MNNKKIIGYCIYGMRVCIIFFIAWVILGFLFGNFRTDGRWIITSILGCLIPIVFMLQVYHYEKKYWLNET